MSHLSKKSILYVAVGGLVFAIFYRLVSDKLSANAREVLMFIAVIGLVVLLVLPLAARRVGFYKEDSLKRINDAMAREESESRQKK
ncbi:MAG TPA: hypothetical protein VHC20_06270 [Candidatus Paceibacterota bacterium]|nr:hypothetical protein [Candidatus Paceibacterota bacterium]